MASPTRKYATLPDLDSAPDIYETPELADDLSTLQTSTARSSSPEASDAEDGPGNHTNNNGNSSNEGRSISHQHLHPDQARTYFSPARVDARDVDFSDRIDERRRSYRTSSAKVVGGDGDGGYEDDGDESDEDQRVRRRLARLQREVGDIKEVIERRNLEGRKDNKEGGEEGAGGKEKQQDKTFAGLVDLVANLKKISVVGGGAEAELKKQLAKKAILGEQAERLESPSTSAIKAPDPTPASTAPPASSSSPSLALERASALETRLTKLESLLGLSNTSLSTPAPTPILPTLTHLNRQLSVLTRLLSTPNPLPAHITSLLERLQSSTAAPTQQPSSTTTTADDDETRKKIEQIYTHLATLDNLTPLLPALLNRLESLHQIHMRAAGAEQALDEAETVQAQLGREIETWRAGVEKLEARMVKNEVTMGRNTEVVEGWVRGLEERVERLLGNGAGGERGREEGL
ncbi:MAG: hypothetical protein M1816_002190 [Peltula sp. TS41687]|nr:MAG: hypothetical protein M1816_002190 [Peltula sp. TS41687]